MAKDPTFAPLLEGMGKLTLEDYKKKLTSEKKSFTCVKNETPARLNECQKTVRDLTGLDFAAAKAEAATLEEQRGKLSAQLIALEHNGAVDAKRLEIREAQLELDKLTAENNAFRAQQTAGAVNVGDLRRQLEGEKSRLSATRTLLEGARRSIAGYDRSIEESRGRWIAVNGEVFTGGTCPTCGQILPFEQLKAATETFEAQKRQRLKDIEDNAALQKESRAAAESRIQSLQVEITDRENRIKELESQIQAANAARVTPVDMEGYADQAATIRARIQRLEGDLQAMNKDTAQAKAGLRSELETIEAQIKHAQEVIAKEGVLQYARQRIEEIQTDANNAAAAANQYLAELQTAGKLSIVVAGDRTADAITYAIKANGLEEVLPPSVAEVNGTPYSTVAAAIAAAADGGEVKLLANAADVAVDKNLTLSADTDVAVTNITVADGKALDLDGQVTAANITLGAGATIVLDDDAAPESNVTVTGGAVGTTIATGAKAVANYEKLKVTNDGLMGYPVEVAGETVIQLVTKGVAKIGDVTYATLEEAVAVAQTNGGTVKLISDAALTAELLISDSMNIETDGVKDRTITSNVTGAKFGIKISCVKNEDTVMLTGTEKSMLVIRYIGSGNTKSLVCSEKVDTVLTYVKIEGANRTEGEGGGLYVTNGHSSLNNCILQNNKSGGGGAMYCTGTGSATLTNCQILNNSSTKYGGAFQGASGSTTTLIGCRVEGNVASNVGGAAYMAQSGGNNPATIIATNTVFKNNSTTKNGGVIRATGAFELTGCEFIGNSGADADISEGNSNQYTRTITNCTFDKTQAAAIAEYDPTKIVLSGNTFAS